MLEKLRKRAKKVLRGKSKKEIKATNKNGCRITIVRNPEYDLTGVEYLTLRRDSNKVFYLADLDNKDLYVWSVLAKYYYCDIRAELLDETTIYLSGTAGYRGDSLLPIYDEMAYLDSNREKIKQGEYDWLSMYNFDIEYLKETLPKYELTLEA